MASLVDLATLPWTLTGWRPYAWKLRRSAETGGFLHPDHGPYPARLPGSVQENLRTAGVIPDWHIGLNSLAIEWVEHRHWMFSTQLPAEAHAAAVVLCAERLDYRGWVLVDGAIAGEFCGAHLSVRLDLTHALTRPGTHELAIVFDLPPEGQGQMGYTSRAREWKPRYNYGWDWCVRVVPIGAGGSLTLERRETLDVALRATRTRVAADLREGTIGFVLDLERDAPPAQVRARLRRADQTIASVDGPVTASPAEFSMKVADPELWWPRGEGAQPLYELEITVTRQDRVIATWTRELGFKRIEWRPCEGAPQDAWPWLCTVNGRPIFLQGVNWTPVRMCYLDTTPTEVRRLVEIYRDLGCNVLRVWGGGHLESADFYAACDRAGLLVWQEFPLSSSGMDSEPPGDPNFVTGLLEVARQMIRSRQHHACLLQWCGGNELHRDVPTVAGKRRQPLDLSHPALAALAELAGHEDPEHRFLPTSPYGPRFHATREEFGRGLHHEVHGPWGLDGFPGSGEWERYWQEDDSLFRGETGVAGASHPNLIRRFAGGDSTWPPTVPLWRHSAGWWTQWDRLGGQFADRDPATALDEFAEFTRREQAEKLATAIRAKKRQFPRCGGFLIWMGHDAFPCPANTSIVEFDHSLKPAALAVKEVFSEAPGTPT